MTEENTTVGINGMAHVILTVSQFEKARVFYGGLLPHFGMSLVHDGLNFSIMLGLEQRSEFANAIQNS